MYSYLQNVNTNVSNANKKMPNVSRSLKSKLWFFIASPPFHNRIEVNTPCNTIVPWFYFITFSPFTQSVFLQIIYVIIFFIFFILASDTLSYSLTYRRWCWPAVWRLRSMPEVWSCPLPTAFDNKHRSWDSSAIL